MKTFELPFNKSGIQAKKTFQMYLFSSKLFKMITVLRSVLNMFWSAYVCQLQFFFCPLDVLRKRILFEFAPKVKTFESVLKRVLIGQFHIESISLFRWKAILSPSLFCAFFIRTKFSNILNKSPPQLLPMYVPRI